MKRLLVILPLFLTLVSCGPIIGQLMRIADGVKNFQVIQGDLAALKKGQKILVVGPFETAPDAWDIARGDDAVLFYNEFNRSGFYVAEVHMGDRYGKADKTVAEVKGKSASQLKADYQLEGEPGLVMFGTVLSRETVVAPARGIIMEVGYRLEFYNPADGKSAVVEITVHEHFKDCIKLVVEELAHRATAAKS